MLRYNIVDGVGPVLQIAEGWTADLPDEVHDTIDVRTDRTWPTTWFAPRLTGEGAFKDVYSVMANWGANHGVIGVRSCGRRPDHAGQHAAHPGDHAQRAAGKGVSPSCLGKLWHTGHTGRGLRRVQSSTARCINSLKIQTVGIRLCRF